MAIQDGASPRRPSTSAQRWPTDTALGWHAIVTVTCAAAKKRPHSGGPGLGAGEGSTVALGPDAILLAVGPPPAAGPRSEWTGERLTYTSTKTVSALLRRFNASIAARGLITLRYH